MRELSNSYDFFWLAEDFISIWTPASNNQYTSICICVTLSKLEQKEKILDSFQPLPWMWKSKEPIKNLFGQVCFYVTMCQEGETGTGEVWSHGHPESAHQLFRNPNTVFMKDRLHKKFRWVNYTLVSFKTLIILKHISYQFTSTGAQIFYQMQESSMTASVSKSLCFNW